MAEGLHRTFPQTWFCSEQVKIKIVPVGGRGEFRPGSQPGRTCTYRGAEAGTSHGFSGIVWWDQTDTRLHCTHSEGEPWVGNSNNLSSLSWRHKDIFTWSWTSPTFSLNTTLTLALPYGLFKVVHYPLGEMLSMYFSIPFIQSSRLAFQEYYIIYRQA